MEISSREKSVAVGKACVAIIDLLQALKGEPLSSGFSTDGSSMSASAVPHCREEKKKRQKEKKKKEEEENVTKLLNQTLPLSSCNTDRLSGCPSRHTLEQDGKGRKG